MSEIYAASGGREGASEAKVRTRITKRLFEEALMHPGGLEKYRYLVEKDIERDAKELKNFKEDIQQEFDQQNGLLPTAPSVRKRNVSLEC